MNLTGLLIEKGIDPKDVLVLRHRPREPKLRKVLPWLAAAKPDVFNAYQQTQPERIEKQIGSAKYVASFVGMEPGKAVFVGLYSVDGSKLISRKQFWQIPGNVVLKSFGMKGFTKDSPRKSVRFFDLVLTDFCAHWKGKLVIKWPPQDRNWHRWAHKPKNKMPILPILDNSALGHLDSKLIPDKKTNSTDREIVRAVERIRSKSGGQGISVSPAARKAIDVYAMEKATAYYVDKGYTVCDVSKNQPYDLRCKRKGKVLFVEVKGTKTAGTEILLTPGEVSLAHAKYPNTALFILHSLTVVEGHGDPMVKGGTVRIVKPWKPEDAMLKPLGYSCQIPQG